MGYKSFGYNKLLYKTSKYKTSTKEVTEAQSSQTITMLSGSSVAGGKTVSSQGKITIDWDKGTIIISDGAHGRVLIGEDGL